MRVKDRGDWSTVGFIAGMKWRRPGVDSEKCLAEGEVKPGS